MKHRRFLFLTVFALVFICGLAVGAGAVGSTQKITASLDYALKVQYNDQVQNLTDAAGQRVYPIVYNNTTYLPIRSISNMLGVNVDWDQASYTALIGENTTRPPAAAGLPADLVGKTLRDWWSPRDGAFITFNADGSFTFELFETIITYMGHNLDRFWNVDVVSVEKTGTHTYLLHLGDVTYTGGKESITAVGYSTPIPPEEAGEPPYEPWSTIQLVLPGASAADVQGLETSYDSRSHYLNGVNFYENSEDQFETWYQP